MQSFIDRFALVISILAVLAVGACAYYEHGQSDAHIKARSVKLEGNGGECSGEQVRSPSGVDYILTAAHCAPLAQAGSIQVTTEGGRVLRRRVIAEDSASDLLLLEGLPNLQGLSIADKDYASQSVRTFTHGNRLDTYETDGVLIQDKKIKVMLGIIASDAQEAYCSSLPKYKIVDLVFFKACVLDVEETVTTALVVPGSSGGMVVDDTGDLVGVVSASGEGFGFLVKLEDIKAFIANY